MRGMTPLGPIIVAKTIGGNGGGDGLTDAVKQALLKCFDDVAWTSPEAKAADMAELQAAMSPLNGIEAVYTQSGAVYTTMPLDLLKADLVVTAIYEGGDPITLDASDYSLSGTLEAGVSTITVTYSEKTTTFDVTVTADTVLWQTKNQSVSGGNVTTNDTLLCDTDKDWSIAYDVDILTNPGSGDASKFALARVISENGTTFALRVYKYTNGTYAFQYMGTYQNNLGSVEIGRLRFVVTHEKESGEASIKLRKGTGDPASKTISHAFTASSKALVLGYSTGENQLPQCTLNEVTVYGRVLSADEINYFLGV